MSTKWIRFRIVQIVCFVKMFFFSFKTSSKHVFNTMVMCTTVDLTGNITMYRYNNKRPSDRRRTNTYDNVRNWRTNAEAPVSNVPGDSCRWRARVDPPWKTVCSCLPAAESWNQIPDWNRHVVGVRTLLLVAGHFLPYGPRGLLHNSRPRTVERLSVTPCIILYIVILNTSSDGDSWE